MKAAVIYEKGGAPFFTTVDEPGISGSGEKMLTVKASALKHLDRSIASGKHYSAQEKTKARVIGGDGVGILDDGLRVFALGVSGMVAERATINAATIVPVPASLDDVTAAALPNAVAGSAMALRFRAKLQPGETVLVNGATGFTGRIAVQLAKHNGAKRVIATGRNARSLQELAALGADETVAIGEETNFSARLKEINAATPIDVVLDYLWGPTAEWIMAALMGRGSYTHRVRYVSVGSMTGDRISLSAANLRGLDLLLSGSGLGSWTGEEMKLLFSEIVPDAFQLAAAGSLRLETVGVPLADINRAWDIAVDSGQRLVVTI